MATRGKITPPPPPKPITIGDISASVAPSQITPQGRGSITPPPPPTPITLPGGVSNTGANNNSTPGYVTHPDPLTGKPAQSIDWSNPPDWLPTKQLGLGLGTLLAELQAPSQDQKDAIAKTMPSAEQMTGSALKTGATIGALALAPETLPGLLATGGGIGAAQAAGGAMTENAPAKDVIGQGVLGGVLGAGTGLVAYGTGGLLNKLGNKSLSMALRPSNADFQDGYDSQFALNNGLTGNAKAVAQKAQSFMTGLRTRLNSELANSPTEGIDLASIFDKTKGDLTSQKGLESNFLQNSKIGNALNTLQDEVLKVNPTGKLPLPNAQDVKQATGMYGEWLGGHPDPEASALGTVANTFYHNMKTAIEDAVPNGPVADLNAQMQKTMPILRAAIRRIPAEERNGMSMTDMLSVLGFPLNPSASVALMAGNHAMKSGLLSQITNPISNAIPKIAPALSAAAPTFQGLLGSFLPKN